MRVRAFIFILCLILVAAAVSPICAQKKQALVIDNFDSLRVIRTDSTEIWYCMGNTRFHIDSTFFAADSAIVYRDLDVLEMHGHAEVYDSIQNVTAGVLRYSNRDSLLLAENDVIFIHDQDSMRSESQFARYDLRERRITLTGQPVLYLNYPDIANLVTVNADTLVYYSESKTGFAKSQVTIDQKDTHATCDSAAFAMRENRLFLSGSPHAEQAQSDISGQQMDIDYAHGHIRQIDVKEEATALFVEETDSAGILSSGKTKLSANQLTFYFKDDEVRKIAANGAARSVYFPPPDDTTDAGKNYVSGDSILIYVQNKKTSKIEVKGGAEGVYITKGEGKDTTVTNADSAAAEAPESDSLTDQASSSWSDFSGWRPADTLSAGEDSLGAIRWPYEDSIHYRGNFLEFYVAKRTICLSGKSVVRQKAVTLDADEIDYDIPQRVVLARAKVDTIGDSIRPVPLSLKDGSDEIFGSRLAYNVDTKKGVIEDATTRFEQAYYTGNNLYKEEEKVFYVSDGTLTSCDLPEPHFHFGSREMKLLHNDKVIARPVTLYIETIPVLAIPYYIFPLKRGRHSGILPIRLGNFERGNRYIGNLGYYWAASEYWDLQNSLDFYENAGVTINSLFRYSKRYAYGGQVLGSFAREKSEKAFSESRRRRWALSGSHRQTLPYNISFNANGNFVSDKSYYTDYSTNPNERLNRTMISKANFNRQFGKSSLSLSFNHTNNLDTDARSSQLPSGSLTMPSFHPFGSGKEIDGKTVKKWYNDFYLGYRNNFAFLIDRKTLNDSTHNRKEYAYLDHSLSLTTSAKVLSYVNLSPSLSFTETWYYILNTNLANQAGIPADAYRRGSVSGGVGANTNLYGTFGINLLGLVALRHVLTPTIGFGWAPAITQHDAVKAYTGRGGGSGASKSLSFDVTQLLQAKVKSGETQKKIDLLRLSSNASYNFEAIGRKFSDLNTSFSTSLGKIDVNGGLEHDLYTDDNKLRWWSPRLKSFSVAISFQLRGSVADDYVRQGLTEAPAQDTMSVPPLPETGYATAESFGQAGTSWNLSVSHRYSESGLLTGEAARTHWLQLTFHMNLTAGWKIKYHQNYDLIAHQSTEKVIDLVRQLHCWEGHFYWIPDGSRRGYYFKINVISIPDLKLEKSESGLRGALFNR